MRLDELREEVKIELDLMKDTVHELVSLQNDVMGKSPTVRERAAAGAFLAQFYGGVENILKRICRFHSVPIPRGETWHVDLFNMFCYPAMSPLPLLFDEGLKSKLAPFRKFRHVVHHGYGFQLEWERMLPGIIIIEDIFNVFKKVVNGYLEREKQFIN